ncbi:MAG: hypothetical protein CSA97_03040 [Bacteroidetes bacterium]|nr:MAG: hypothetical protein CSA97_03040 [Bacteroidota bacterium]
MHQPSPKHPNRFPRSERLRLKKEIDATFKVGQKAFCFPYRAVFRIAQGEGVEVGVRVAMVAPKRLWKHAVDRNYQKRRLRELYRTQAGALRQLAQEHELGVSIMLICVSRDEVPLEKATRSVFLLLRDVERACLRRVDRAEKGRKVDGEEGGAKGESEGRKKS